MIKNLTKFGNYFKSKVGNYKFSKIKLWDEKLLFVEKAKIQ